MSLSRTTVFAAVLAVACPASTLFAQALPIDTTPQVIDTQTPKVDAQKAIDTAAPMQSSNAFKDLIAPLGHDLTRVVTNKQNLMILGIGSTAALTAHSFDQRVSHTQWPGGSDTAFAPAQFAGDSLIQLGSSVALYSVGRISGHNRLATVSAEIFRAQMVAEVYTRGLKYAAGRTRPDGTSYSFPSGHTSSMFATATVLQSEFGWKAALPAYAAATWVGASRIEKNRHYFSDVVAGATVGILAGRSVTIGSGKARFAVSPMAAPGGAGISFTKVAKP